MSDSHATLVDALGGGTALAHALEEVTGIAIDRENIYKWKENGIPWRWRPQVAGIAKTQGIKLPKNFLEPQAAA